MTQTTESSRPQHETINYLELPSRDLDKTKAFFQTALGWEFADYGPEYSAFANAGIDGGFYLTDKILSTDNGSALLVLYSDNLEQTEATLIEAGASILKPVFSFPGGRRFHFADPNGNEYGVWSDG